MTRRAASCPSSTLTRRSVTGTARRLEVGGRTPLAKGSNFGHGTAKACHEAGVRWQGHESCGSRILGHPSDGRSVGLALPQGVRADNPTEPFQPLALSKQSAVRALKSVSVTRPFWAPWAARCNRPIAPGSSQQRMAVTASEQLPSYASALR